jgi:hypothetical protein
MPEIECRHINEYGEVDRWYPPSQFLLPEIRAGIEAMLFRADGSRTYVESVTLNYDDGGHTEFRRKEPNMSKRITRKQVREFVKTLPNTTNMEAAGGCVYATTRRPPSDLFGYREPSPDGNFPGCLVGQVVDHFVGLERAVSLPSVQVIETHGNEVDMFMTLDEMRPHIVEQMATKFLDAGFTPKAIMWMGIAQQFADQEEPWQVAAKQADRILGLED